MNKSVAVLGVVFSGIESFLGDYLSSLESQTFRAFDLVIMNNGLENFMNFKKRSALEITEISCGASPAKVRELGINHIKNKGYDYVVFTDPDDFYSENRVERSLELLQYYDIVVNDLNAMTESGKVFDPLYISNRLDNMSEPGFDFILDKNIFGFSNTALRLDCLTSNLVLEEDLVAIDWYLFSGLVKKGCHAVFTNDAVTFYRIYGGNTVGLSSAISRQKLERGVAVKCLHYKLLSEIDASFRPLHKEFERLKKSISLGGFLESYMERIKSLDIDKPLWWEEIQVPGESKK
jgi:glycosyltransferase involved in cell wall biosynthesis